VKFGDLYELLSQTEAIPESACFSNMDCLDGILLHLDVVHTLDVELTTLGQQTGRFDLCDNHIGQFDTIVRH
jgi:hypothetical protein